MNIEMEYVPGTPGDVQLIDVTHFLNQASWLIDPEADREATRELAAELRLMAGWLGLDEVRVQPKGDLAEDLSKALT